MEISIIGTGRMGKALAKILDKYTEKVYWGSRNIEKLPKLIEDLELDNTIPISIEQALNSDIIIPTLWYKDLVPWLTEHKEILSSKILLDIVNPFNSEFSDFTTEWGTSASEEIQKHLPNTKIVGAFKNTFFSIFEQPYHNNKVSDVYVTSDDEEAKSKVIRLLKPLPFRVLDAGSLKNNRIIERMTLLEREISIRYKSYPYVAYSLFGLPVDSGN